MSGNKHHFKDSSSIAHCDYHEDKDTMEIQFVNGGCYHYTNCPKEEFEALKKADSPGKHFHSKLRHRFKGVKVSG